MCRRLADAAASRLVSPAAAADADAEGGAPLLTITTRLPVHDLVAAPAHADLLLQLVTQADSVAPLNSANVSGSAPARSYQCSADTLSAQSAFFKLRLSDKWQLEQQQQQEALQQQQQATGAAGAAPSATRTIEVHVEEGELEAMHMLLTMIHSHSLPADAPSQPCFFQCMRLATQFQAIDSLDMLVAALADMPAAKQMPADIAKLALLRCAAQAMAAPAAAAAASPFRQNLSKARVRAMLQLYGDVPAVINDAALSAEFCSRPHAAVLGWAGSDDLRVHSENCVVFLLSAWVTANPTSTAEQLEQLAHQVRVFHLGPAYQQQVLPDLAWFKGCGAMQHWPGVMACVRTGVSMKQGVEVQKKALYGHVLGMVTKLPDGWTSKPRKCSSRSKVWTWSMAPRGLDLFNSSAVFVNGFMVDLKVQCCDTAATAPPPPGKRICVSIGIDRTAMRQRGLPLQLPDHTLLRLGAVSFKVTGAGSSLELVSADIVRPYHAISVADRVGCYTAFGSAPTFEQLVAPYLLQDKLSFHITFTVIDG